MSKRRAMSLLALRLSIGVFALVSANAVDHALESCDEDDDSSSFLQVQSNALLDDASAEQDDSIDPQPQLRNYYEPDLRATQLESVGARVSPRSQGSELAQVDALLHQLQEQQRVAPRRNHMTNRDTEDAYILDKQSQEKVGREMAPRVQKRQRREVLQDSEKGGEVTSLAEAQMLLNRERERVRDLEEYVKLADSNNRKLAALEEQHAGEVTQFRGDNARLQAELADVRERCKSEIEQVFADRASELALVQVGGVPACMSFSKNGASPVVDSTSCDNACSTAEGIGCSNGGCYYHGAANASKCGCPIRKSGVVKSTQSLCQDPGYNAAGYTTLSLSIIAGVLLFLIC